ncbi:hypothetical protein GXW82_30020 [Streptacidiphilus sp. 4-A2]|nr:hypothetical protein [Streptacidiphilus sp. 4-A2]
MNSSDQISDWPGIGEPEVVVGEVVVAGGGVVVLGAGADVDEEEAAVTFSVCEVRLCQAPAESCQKPNWV